MTRQRRLRVNNRLEELNAKFGPVGDVLPDWLDHLIEPPEALPSAPPEDPTPPPRVPPRKPGFDLTRWAT